MGTRHLICVWYNGEWVVAQYGQWDGYPEGQGSAIFKFLVVPGNIDKLKSGLERTYQLSDAEVEDLGKYPPSLSRDAGAKILSMIAGIDTADAERDTDSVKGDEDTKLDAANTETKIPLLFSLEFANNGLFCEWAYVIDLDTNVLEIFGGSQYKTQGHRFKDVGADNDSVPGLYCTLTFEEIFQAQTEDEFIDIINQKTGDGGNDEENDKVEQK